MISLRPYQTEAVAAINAAFRSGHRRVLFVLPTGGGKTVVFTYIASRIAAANLRLLILVHRDELITQVSEALMRWGVYHGIIAGGRKGNVAPVQVCSVFTLARRLAGKHGEQLRDWLNPALIIVDEAHHAVAGSWATVAAAFPRSRQLGVTATPIRLDGKGLAAQFDYLVAGSKVSELIAGGHLVPAEVYAPPTVDLSGVHTRMGDFDRKQLGAAMDKPKIYGSAVEHYQKYGKGMPGVAFCVNVAHAERAAEEYRRAGIPSVSVDGKLDTMERRRRVQGLADGSVKVLTSCDLISEGFDCPAIGVAILLRPTQSESLYLQQVGRALRPYAGKSHAIILDHVGNCMRHGLPTEDREWTLTHDKVKTKGGAGLGLAIPKYKQCLECYMITPASSLVCPRGHVFPVADDTPEEVAGELQKVGANTVGRNRKAPERVRMEVSPETCQRMIAGAKSLKQMHEVARMLGKSSGWAFMQWKHRGIRAAPTVTAAPVTAPPRIPAPSRIPTQYDPTSSEAF